MGTILCCLFGKGQIANLPSVIGGFGKKVLLTYGGGSIKRMVLFDKVKELLGDCEIHELSGIAPNPQIESVREGISLWREHGIDVILAVGGYSVIDCSKAVASAFYYEGDASVLAGRRHGRLSNTLVMPMRRITLKRWRPTASGGIHDCTNPPTSTAQCGYGRSSPSRTAPVSRTV